MIPERYGILQKGMENIGNSKYVSKNNRLFFPSFLVSLKDNWFLMAKIIAMYCSVYKIWRSKIYDKSVVVGFLLCMWSSIILF